MWVVSWRRRLRVSDGSRLCVALPFSKTSCWTCSQPARLLQIGLPRFVSVRVVCFQSQTNVIGILVHLCWKFGFLTGWEPSWLFLCDALKLGSCGHPKGDVACAARDQLNSQFWTNCYKTISQRWRELPMLDNFNSGSLVANSFSTGKRLAKACFNSALDQLRVAFICVVLMFSTSPVFECCALAPFSPNLLCRLCKPIQ